jgi:D-amino-acid dehydrogenase
LLQLNSHTLELFDELRDDGVDFEMHSAGLLALARSSDGLKWFTQLFDQLLPMGFPGGVEYLSGDEARRRDAAVGPGVQVAAHTSIDRHVNPESLLRGLLERVTEMGVTVLQHTAVEAVIPGGARWSIRTPDHSLDVDRVVIALGAATNALLTPLGIQLPIIGAKGYSIDVRGAGTSPRHALQAGTEPVPRRDTHRRRIRTTCPRRTGPRAADPTPRGPGTPLLGRMVHGRRCRHSFR